MGQFQDISLAQVTVLHDPMNIHIKMPLVTANYIKFGVSIEILQLLLDYPATSHNKIRQESSRESCWAHPIRPIPTIPCPLSSPAFKSTPCPWRPSKSCHRAKTGTASQRVQDISGAQVTRCPCRTKWSFVLPKSSSNNLFPYPLVSFPMKIGDFP
jgi:hypothetical protein